MVFDFQLEDGVVVSEGQSVTITADEDVVTKHTGRHHVDSSGKVAKVGEDPMGPFINIDFAPDDDSKYRTREFRWNEIESLYSVGGISFE